jgi:hypothetical protein
VSAFPRGVYLHITCRTCALNSALILREGSPVLLFISDFIGTPDPRTLCRHPYRQRGPGQLISLRRSTHDAIRKIANDQTFVLSTPCTGRRIVQLDEHSVRLEKNGTRTRVPMSSAQPRARMRTGVQRIFKNGFLAFAIIKSQLKYPY